MTTIEERFWSKVDKRGDDECWPWTGAKSDGYGMIKAGGKNLYAHRVSWSFTNGEIPPGLFVLHSCDNPPCVNPAHLFPGTNTDNMQDAARKGRIATGDRHGRRTRPERNARGDRNGSRLHPERLARGDRHWTRLHPENVLRGDRHGSKLHPERMPRGEGHGRARLTETDVVAIRASTDTLDRLAERFGVGRTTIGHVVHGRTWRHVL